MHKKTAKSHRLTDKSAVIRDSRSAKMTISQHRTIEDGTGGGRLTSTGKSRLSSDWDHQTDHGSWSEEIEDVASRRILEHWDIVERTLYDEEEQLPPGPIFDECLQWRNQLPHLRIVGRGYHNPENGGTRRCETSASSKASSAIRRREKSAQRNEKSDELLGLEGDFFPKELSVLSSNQQSYRQAKDEVLDYIVEFICKELAEIEAEKEAENNLSDNFDEFLKIAPAPTTTGKNPLVSNNFYHKIENADTPTIKEKKENEKEKDSQVGRNKLGTVFNERIIVSPVPFIVTSRESFTTLRRTPILYVAKDNGVFNNSGSESRRENTRRKLSLTRKAPLITAPHVQSSWNTPVCPTIWPKNVKLTPIDTSRLPSSKRRTSKTAESIPQRRSRNSLSPISRSVQPTSPRCCGRNDGHLYAGLEIRGSHIVPQLVDGKVGKIKPAQRVKRIGGQ